MSLSIDGVYSPFADYPGYSSMAPCMRRCNDDMGFNGCDNSGCWCKKDNLDLRIATITRCAETSCTFANMNTQTDADQLSGIQVQYCIDKGVSPAGMTVPSTAEASPTESSPAETGTVETMGSGSATRSRPTSGPAETSDSTSSNPSSQTSGTSSSNSSNTNSSDSLSTAAKAGIGIGATFCALLAILILLLLFRRRKRAPQYISPPQNGNFQGPNGPQMAPLQQPAPLHIPPQNKGLAGTKGDVSPIEEKAPAFGTAAAISRKEVGAGAKHDVSPQGTPGPRPAQPHADTAGPREVYGSVPPPRHEVPNDAEITNTVTTRGMELDGQQRAFTPHQQQQPPVNQYPGYQESGQGPWRHELPGRGGQTHVGELPGAPGHAQGQRGYGGAYELGPGR